MGAPKRRRRSARKRREGQWGGIQFPRTNIPVAGVFQDLANNLSTEERERTCVGVRGWMQAGNTGSDAASGGVECAMKLVSANLNDALVITDDIQAIDLSLEDIQQRQLWTFYTHFEPRTTFPNHQGTTIEINVRVKIKLPARSKQAFGMLIDSSTVNRLQVSGYLRAYYVY